MNRQYIRRPTDLQHPYDKFNTTKLQFRQHKSPEPLNTPNNVNLNQELSRSPFDGGKSHRHITLRKKDKKNHRRSHHRRGANKKSRKGCKSRKSRKLRRRVRS